MKTLSSFLDHYIGSLSIALWLTIAPVFFLIWFALNKYESVKTDFLCQFFAFSIETKGRSRVRARSPKR